MWICRVGAGHVGAQAMVPSSCVGSRVGPAWCGPSSQRSEPCQGLAAGSGVQQCPLAGRLGGAGWDERPSPASQDAGAHVRGEGVQDAGAGEEPVGRFWFRLGTGCVASSACQHQGLPVGASRAEQDRSTS